MPSRFRPWTYTYVSGGTMSITTTAALGTSDSAAMGVLDAVASRIGSSATRTADQLVIKLMN
jgi:hypothetical protein